MTVGQTDGIVKIALTGRIDSENAVQTEGRIQACLEGQDGAPVILDASRLTYISSAGLRILLRLKKAHPDTRITGVNTGVYDILEMTGFTEILKVEKAYRQVSVDGCEVVGEGANGKVYRIGRETAVKVYKNAESLSEIHHEQEMAKMAFVLGIPTAISYDVVRVGDSYGSVFELLEARSFAGMIPEGPEQMEWCVREYVNMLRTIHHTKAPEGKLPSAKAKALEEAAGIVPFLPEDKGEKLVRILESIPETGTLIHGDCHTRNIVLAGGEVLLIDMETLAAGHPVFELAQMFNAYIGFGEYDPQVILRFQGFDADTARDFWKRTLRAYLKNADEARILEAENLIRCVAYTYLLGWGCRHLDPDKKADRETFSLWKRKLLELLSQAGDGAERWIRMN